MEVINCELKGISIISPPTDFEDFRGKYIELYNKRLYRQYGIEQNFIQDDISISNKNVLRGIHGDNTTWKLISCLLGSFYLILVNNDPESDQFRKWTSITLSETNIKQVLVPPKFGNGHLVMSERAIFHYKQTTEYDRNSQFTILWDDPAFDFWWPSNNPILSRRDNGLT